MKISSKAIRATIDDLRARIDQLPKIETGAGDPLVQHRIHREAANDLAQYLDNTYGARVTTDATQTTRIRMHGITSTCTYGKAGAFSNWIIAARKRIETSAAVAVIAVVAGIGADAADAGGYVAPVVEPAIVAAQALVPNTLAICQTPEECAIKLLAIAALAGAIGNSGDDRSTSSHGNTDGDETAVVSIPAAGFMLLGALAPIGLLRRRRKGGAAC